MRHDKSKMLGGGGEKRLTPRLLASGGRKTEGNVAISESSPALVQGESSREERIRGCLQPGAEQPCLGGRNKRGPTSATREGKKPMAMAVESAVHLFEYGERCVKVAARWEVGIKGEGTYFSCFGEENKELRIVCHRALAAESRGGKGRALCTLGKKTIRPDPHLFKGMPREKGSHEEPLLVKRRKKKKKKKVWRLQTVVSAKEEGTTRTTVQGAREGLFAPYVKRKRKFANQRRKKGRPRRRYRRGKLPPQGEGGKGMCV